MRYRVRWVLIFWMFIISAIAYLDRVNVSIAVSAIQKEFGFTDLQFGPVFSAFVIGYALFQAPGGWLADRFGPRKVLTFGVLWWGVFTTITALVPAGIAGALGLMIAVRFVLGVGEAVVYPSSNRLVATWIPSHERGVANGLIFAGVGFGAGVTPPIITYVLIHYGWRWSFFVCAILGTLAGIVWWILARDDPKEHPSVTPEERELIARGLPQSAAIKGGQRVPWSAIFGSKDVLAIGASYFTYGYVAYIFFTWFFKYLNDVRGLDLKSSAAYAMLPFLAMATCSPLGGWISDRLTKQYGRRIGRCGIAVVGIALAGVFIALATQVESARLASLVLAGGAGALYLSQSSFWAVTADIAGPSAGSVSGLMNMGGQIGGAVTASLTPWIAQQFGWTASFLTAAALCILGSVTWLVVNPDAQLARDRTSVTA
ncbi:MAG: MFS transporter [Bryobacteraceae bacterium]|nr:MFS transporter [Bryobacteraceae bacterium]